MSLFDDKGSLEFGDFVNRQSSLDHLIDRELRETRLIKQSLLNLEKLEKTSQLIYLKHECELEDIDIINFGREAIKKTILTDSKVRRRRRLTDGWVIKTSLAN